MDNFAPAASPEMAGLSRNGVRRADASAFSRFEVLEAWISRNAAWVAIGMIVPAIALRVYFAGGCYLGVDEALRFLAARPASLHDAYKASRLLPQPPLYIFVLHWTIYVIGRSEVELRLPSVLAAAGSLGFIFAWIRRLLGGVPALVGVLFFAVSQSALAAGSEMRQHGLLLFFISAALYATERASSESSVRWVILQSTFLGLALLTDYSAAIPLGAIALYVLIQIRLGQIAPRTVVAFALAGLALTAEIAVLYFHLIRHSSAFSSVNLATLAPAFYNPQVHTFLDYSWLAVFRTFVYMVGFGNHWSHQVGLLVFLVFAAGLAAIFAGRTKAGWPAAVLIAAPFVIGFAAALAWLLPFGGTRHEAYLLPFYAASLSAGFAWIPRGKRALPLLVVTVLACLWAWADKSEDPGAAQPDLDPRYYSIADMNSALRLLENRVPAGAPLFVDEATRLELSYYLGRNNASLDALNRSMDNGEILEGHRIITPPGYVWALPNKQPLVLPCQSAQALGVPHGDPIWIVKVEWPLRALETYAPEKALLVRTYRGINVVEAICP